MKKAKERNIFYMVLIFFIIIGLIFSVIFKNNLGFLKSLSNLDFGLNIILNTVIIGALFLLVDTWFANDKNIKENFNYKYFMVLIISLIIEFLLIIFIDMSKKLNFKNIFLILIWNIILLGSIILITKLFVYFIGQKK